MNTSKVNRESAKVIESQYRSCTNCIMNDLIDKKITFDDNNICNHCNRYKQELSSRILKGESAKQALDLLVGKIKSAGKGKDYDCLIGVSGGVDSTYVAYLVKSLGLRPLAIHFDNGWNSELAVKNIEKVLNKLNIDLVTHVVDWEEFRDLQISFLQSSTPDGEIPTDHGINALLWKTALKYNIKYIISGQNFATESISVPDWAYGHTDWRYIKDVHNNFSKKPLTTYPHFHYSFLFYANIIRGVRSISILNYVDYNKMAAMNILQDELGWIYYGGKHYESIYTRFFQGYILPEKFGIDKRYGHLSDLINSGQMSREQALEEMEHPPYPEKMQKEDLVYVVKKLGLSIGEFESIMNREIKSFRDYKNSYRFLSFLKKVINYLRYLGVYPR